VRGEEASRRQILGGDQGEAFGAAGWRGTEMISLQETEQDSFSTSVGAGPGLCCLRRELKNLPECARTLC